MNDTPPLNSVAGIQSMEIVPGLNPPSVIPRLQQAIGSADRLRAAIAYWVIGADDVSKSLIRKLSGQGFLCVDISLPTSIDELNRMKCAGANVYLHLVTPNPQPGELKIKMPPHLMHTKMLLFDLSDGKAELWVGSHNWTNRALTGLNFEASCIAKLNNSSELYSNAAQYLDAIRLCCEPFDPARVGYYKWLQAQQLEGEVAWTVELESDDPASYAGKHLSIYLVSESDYSNLKKVDKPIKLSVIRTGSDVECLYVARITDTGYLTSSGVTFDARLHAFQPGSPRPKIVGPAVPPQAQLSKSRFWATLEVGEMMSEEYGSFDLPPEKPWLPSKGDELEHRVRKEDRIFFEAPDRPLVCRPSDKIGSSDERAATYQASSSGKAGDDGAPLMRKKIIRRRRT